MGMLPFSIFQAHQHPALANSVQKIREAVFIVGWGVGQQSDHFSPEQIWS